MDDFPTFMMNSDDEIDQSSQSNGVRGWVYDGNGENQMAYWKCERDLTSKEHTHEFDEYFVVVQGEYVLIIDNREIVVKAGEEYYIPKGVLHAGKATAGTRTIHCFGGRRAVRKK